MYKGGGGRCCHNCIQRNVECGESEGGREVERDEGGRHRDGNLKLIPTSGVVERRADAKMENILSEFQHFAFYLRRPGGWPLLRMGWDESG